MNNICNNKEVFLQAFALVSNPDTWCQGYFAVDNDNNNVSTQNTNACKFCSLGAIAKVLQLDCASFKRAPDNIWDYDLPHQFDNYCKNTLGVKLADYNDCFTQEKIIKLWRDFGIFKGYLNA